MAPIEIRDPVAEVLGVLPEGEPFRFEYTDVVRIAGHSCPAAAGAYRVTRKGLDALFQEIYPVRSRIAVDVGASRDSHPAGVIARLVSAVTGASGPDGFGGLGEGYGDRANLLTYGTRSGEGLRFGFQRTDTAEAVEVTYFLSDVPEPGDGVAHLPAVIDGSADPERRREFEEAWHDRVAAVLTDDGLFDVERIEPFRAEAKD